MKKLFILTQVILVTMVVVIANADPRRGGDWGWALNVLNETKQQLNIAIQNANEEKLTEVIRRHANGLDVSFVNKSYLLKVIGRIALVQTEDHEGRDMI